MHREDRVAPGRRPSARLAMLVLAAAALAAFYVWSYHESLHGFFVLDDYWVMSAASRIHVRSPLDLVQFAVRGPDFGLYRPLSTVGYFYVLRRAWGYDPFSYHATHLAVHVLNALLAYGIASRLLGSRAAGLATAIAYACAPGHAFAVSWLALFTVTGTVLLYFLALSTWIGRRGSGRRLATFALFCLSLLASEHAVTLPIVLTLLAVLVEPRRSWRAIAREQAAFYAVATAYAAARLYFMLVVYPSRTTPAQYAYFLSGYAMVADPRSVLLLLGRYVGYAVNLAYEVPSTGYAPLVIGALAAVLAAGATVAVLTGRWTARPLRVATFGIDLFVVAVGPVLLLPEHVYSCYVGIAALGVALALVGAAAALPGTSRVAPWLVAGVLLATHFSSTLPRLMASKEMAFVRDQGRWTARWLYTVAVAARSRPREVVVPDYPVTHQLFGDAHRLLLCASYDVRIAPDIHAVVSAPGRAVVWFPFQLPDAVERDWRRLLRPCSARGVPPPLPEPPSSGFSRSSASPPA